MKQSCAESSIRRALAFREILHGLALIGIGQRHHHEIGQRQGKVLLVDLPRSWPADVLDTHHAEAAVFLPQRHVEHRPDTVRRQGMTC